MGTRQDEWGQWDSDPVGCCLGPLGAPSPLPSPGSRSSSPWSLAVDAGQALDSMDLIFKPMFCSRKMPRDEGRPLCPLPAGAHPVPEACADTAASASVAVKACRDAPAERQVPGEPRLDPGRLSYSACKGVQHFTSAAGPRLPRPSPGGPSSRVEPGGHSRPVALRLGRVGAVSGRPAPGHLLPCMRVSSALDARWPPPSPRTDRGPLGGLFGWNFPGRPPVCAISRSPRGSCSP